MSVLPKTYRDHCDLPICDSVIQRLPAVLTPLLHGLSKMLGMHVSLVMGRPDPIKGGQINVIG